MDYAKLLERPQGELRIRVHLRRGVRHNAAPSQCKKTLEADVIDIRTTLAEMRQQSEEQFDVLEPEELMQLLAHAYDSITTIYNQLDNLNSMMITVDGARVYIHPGDVSHVTVKVSGVWEKARDLNDANNA